MRTSLRTNFLLTLAFLALGACLLLASTGQLRAEGVRVSTVAIGEGSGRLYRPAAARSEIVPLYEEPTGGAHIPQADSVVTDARFAAALVLHESGDGAEALAVEFARRGVAVLIPGRSVDARAAWDWLMGQSFTRVSSAAIIAGSGRAAEAFSLGGEMSATNMAAAATIVLGDEDTLRLAADYPGRDLLILTADEPSGSAKEAYFGAQYDPRRNFSGYFGEGTARAVAAVGRRNFSARRALLQCLDWQGSTLGHAVALPDEDILYGRIVFCRTAAALCVFAAGSVWLPAGNRKKTK